MKKKLVLSLVIAIIATALIAHPDHHDHDHGKNTISQTVKVNDLNFVFDIMTRSDFKKVMKHDFKTQGPAKHLVVLTLNDASNQPVKGAKVKITVKGADGKTKTEEAKIVEGNGMYHYVAAFAMNKKGNYSAEATVTSTKTSTAKIEFKI